MSITQWDSFLDACKKTPQWNELKFVERLRDEKVEKPAGSVSGYELCEHFVRPWTLKTGAGVALLLNETPQIAELMLSHTWSEDMEEVQEMLNNLSAPRGGPKPKALADDIDDGFVDAEAFGLKTRIWFCIFANYQGEDIAGLTITDQLQWDPFRSVLRSKATQKMVVLTTSIAEVYERLWCCFEVGVAIKERGMRTESGGKDFVQAAFSAKAVALAEETQGMIECDASKATCGRQSDMEMITKLIEDMDDGFDGLNAVIQDFRSGGHYNKSGDVHYFRSGSCVGKLVLD
jgi:hypothetical protein